MLPEGWREQSLGELLREPPRNGYSPKEWASWTGTLMLGLGCLTREGFSPNQLKNAPMGDPELGRAMLQHGDVLLSRSNTREAVGFIGVYEDVGAPCIYPDLMMRLRLGPEMQDCFLVRCLQAPLGRRQIEAMATGTSGSMVKVNRASVERLRLPVPPVREQETIADVLGTLDRTIAKTEQLVAKLKQLKQGLLQDLLTRGIDENGELRDPMRQPEEFVESPLGMIPRRWEVAPVERLLASVEPAMRSGPFGSALLKSELVESGIPILGIDNVHAERFIDVYTRFLTPAKAATLARYRVRPHDVMITIMGTVGRCCVVPEHVGEALSSKHVWTLSFDRDRYSPVLACLQFNYGPWVLRHLRRDEQGGIMSAIRSETLRSVRLPVPPILEALEIERILATLSQRIELEQQESTKLRLLKHGLMDDLLTGRVRVTPLLAEATP